MFSFFLPVPFLFRTPAARSRLIQMHWLPSNEQRGDGREKGSDPPGSEGGLVSLLAKREREREGSRGTCISESGRWSWYRCTTQKRGEESISSSSSSASVSSSAPMTRGEDGRGTDSLLPTGAEVDDRKGGKGEMGGDTTRPEDWILVAVVLQGYTTEKDGVWIGGGGGSVYHRLACSSRLARVSCTHTQYLLKEDFFFLANLFFLLNRGGNRGWILHFAELGKCSQTPSPLPRRMQIAKGSSSSRRPFPPN